MRKSVCIVGLGLIGGSLGMALRRRGWEVSYVDPAVSLEAARGAGAADRRLGAPEGGLVVLATPLQQALDLLQSLSPGAAVVTSACSVMGPLAALRRPDLVAGHPFAGSERSGLQASRADLFDGKLWFVERHEERVDRVIEAAGARAEIMDPDEHDRTLALTSHLPQAVSTALASLLADIDPRFVGSGARSVMRLAGSSAAVWEPVLQANRGNVDAAVNALVEKLRHLTREDFETANRAASGLRIED